MMNPGQQQVETVTVEGVELTGCVERDADGTFSAFGLPSGNPAGEGFETYDDALEVLAAYLQTDPRRASVPVEFLRKGGAQ